MQEKLIDKLQADNRMLRIENEKLKNSKAILSIVEWKRISN